MMLAAFTLVLGMIVAAGDVPSNRLALTPEQLAAQPLRFREEREQLRRQLSDPATPFDVLLGALASQRVEVRRIAAEAAKVRRDGRVGEQLLRRLEQERDLAAAFKLAVAVADHEEITPATMRASVTDHPDDPVLPQAYEQYMRAKIQLVMDSLVHNGILSGFYQGQFQPLYRLADDMADRLVAMANDDRLHPVVREISIMALNESNDRALPAKLQGLIRDPIEEASVELNLGRSRRRSEEEQPLIQEMERSKYARFALAKAGHYEAVREKIKTLNWILADMLDHDAYRSLRWLLGTSKDEVLRLADERPTDPAEKAKLDQVRAKVLDGMEDMDQAQVAEVMFAIAYNYQQLKRYDDCIPRYKLIGFLFGQSVAGNSVAMSAYYNLACIYALSGEKEKALDQLQSAIDIGYFDFQWAMEDRDLVSLREEPRFKKMLAIGG